MSELWISYPLHTVQDMEVSCQPQLLYVQCHLARDRAQCFSLHPARERTPLLRIAGSRSQAQARPPAPTGDTTVVNLCGSHDVPWSSVAPPCDGTSACRRPTSSGLGMAAYGTVGRVERVIQARANGRWFPSAAYRLSLAVERGPSGVAPECLPLAASSSEDSLRPLA